MQEGRFPSGERNDDVEEIVARIYSRVIGKSLDNLAEVFEANVRLAMTTAFAEGALYGAANATPPQRS
jgi:hypothetical protein